MFGEKHRSCDNDGRCGNCVSRPKRRLLWKTVSGEVTRMHRAVSVRNDVDVHSGSDTSCSINVRLNASLKLTPCFCFETGHGISGLTVTQERNSGAGPTWTGKTCQSAMQRVKIDRFFTLPQGTCCDNFSLNNHAVIPGGSAMTFIASL